MKLIFILQALMLNEVERAFFTTIFSRNNLHFIYVSSIISDYDTIHASGTPPDLETVLVKGGDKDEVKENLRQTM